jgi:hypothetical protein
MVKLKNEFFAKRRAPATFCLAKKFGEIDPKITLSLTVLPSEPNPNLLKSNIATLYIKKV